MLSAVSKSPRALAAILAAICAAGLAVWYFSGHAALDPAQVNTILVLPIEDGTEFREWEDHCDAVAETLISALGSAENLQVIARTTSAVYKVRFVNLADIRDRTGADTVLDGRMEKAGQQIRLSLRMRRASDGKTVWTDELRAAPVDLLASVDRTAHALGQKLGRAVRSKPLTAVKEQLAFELYADARKRLRAEGPADLNRAMTNLAKAQAASPDFAPITASTMDLYGWATTMDFMRRGVARERIDAGAKAARAADANNPETYFAEGALAMAVDWKWDVAETSLKKAVALRPSYVAAWLALGRLHEALGRFPEALDAMARAHKLDPLGRASTHDYALALVLNGKSDEAIRVLDRYSEIEPDVKPMAIVRALALFGKGDYAGARGVMRSMLHLLDWKPPVYGVLVPAEMRAGDPNEARRLLNELEKLDADPRMDSVIMAGARLAVGEEGKAFQDLRDAVENHASAMRTVEANPIFKDYRNDPRMQTLLKQMRAAK
jgi:TolB-like protein/Flp pilus assembly protein TadD